MADMSKSLRTEFPASFDLERSPLGRALSVIDHAANSLPALTDNQASGLRSLAKIAACGTALGITCLVTRCQYRAERRRDGSVILEPASCAHPA